MIEWILLAAFIALVVVALNRRRLVALPVEYKVRRIANQDLTGARFRWGPFWRRRHVRWAIVFNAGLMMAVLLALAPHLEGYVFVVLFTWAMFFAIFLQFHAWYDDLAFRTRALKVWGLDRVPWAGNVHVWRKGYGKLSDANPMSDTVDARVHVEPRAQQAYLVAAESAPDKWWGRDPDDGAIVVFPTWAGAESVKAGPPARSRRAQAKAAAEAAPPEDEEEDEEMGGGRWNGYDYLVNGVPHVYPLGGGGVREILPYLSPLARRIMASLDEECRAFIYARWPNSKWWRPVILIESPAPFAGPPPGPDGLVLLANMDLRTELEQTRRDWAVNSSAYVRELERLSRRR